MTAQPPPPPVRNPDDPPWNEAAPARDVRVTRLRARVADEAGSSTSDWIPQGGMWRCLADGQIRPRRVLEVHEVQVDDEEWLPATGVILRMLGLGARVDVDAAARARQLADRGGSSVDVPPLTGVDAAKEAVGGLHERPPYRMGGRVTVRREDLEHQPSVMAQVRADMEAAGRAPVEPEPDRLDDFTEDGHLADCESARLAGQTDEVPFCGCAGRLRDVADELAKQLRLLTEPAPLGTAGVFAAMKQVTEGIPVGESPCLCGHTLGQHPGFAEMGTGPCAGDAVGDCPCPQWRPLRPGGLTAAQQGLTELELARSRETPPLLALEVLRLLTTYAPRSTVEAWEAALEGGAAPLPDTAAAMSVMLERGYGVVRATEPEPRVYDRTAAADAWAAMMGRWHDHELDEAWATGEPQAMIRELAMMLPTTDALAGRDDFEALLQAFNDAEAASHPPTGGNAAHCASGSCWIFCLRKALAATELRLVHAAGEHQDDDAPAPAWVQNLQERLDRARQALADTGFWATADLVGDDLAPRILELHGELTDRLHRADALAEQYSAALAVHEATARPAHVAYQQGGAGQACRCARGINHHIADTEADGGLCGMLAPAIVPGGETARCGHPIGHRDPDGRRRHQVTPGDPETTFTWEALQWVADGHLIRAKTPFGSAPGQVAAMCTSPDIAASVVELWNRWS